MADDTSTTASPPTRPDYVGLAVSAGLVAFLALAAALATAHSWIGWDLLHYLFGTAVISVVIWQARDPFADTAQWVGDTFRIPGSVRGATLDAIASSMPELFTGLFFVLVAYQRGVAQGEQLTASGEGYGSTVATAAGSAVYNMVLIPAFVTLIVAVRRKHRPVVRVGEEVIVRDGITFLVCEAVLLVFLFSHRLYWWMSIVFLLMYVAYVWLLYRHTRRYQHVKAVVADTGTDAAPRAVQDRLEDEGTSVDLDTVEEAQGELESTTDAEAESVTYARACYGLVTIPVNRLTALPLLLGSTAAAAAACYFLVEVTRQTADLLGLPTFFVAVILAAAASSIPDTLLSIGAALRGDDSGAVSNAFGSNIFDICICLGLPLLLNTWLVGWQPISLLEDGEPIEGLVGLRVLLAVLSAVTLAIMWHGRKVTPSKAYVLLGLYGIFLAYAVLGSLGWLAL